MMAISTASNFRRQVNLCTFYAALASTVATSRPLQFSSLCGVLPPGAIAVRRHRKMSFISTPFRNNVKKSRKIYSRKSGRSLSSLHASVESEEEIKRKTSMWVDNVVIGLNFCPFAEKSRSQKKLFTTVVRSDDVEDILSVVLYESILREDDAGTTVIVCPELNPDNFIEFYEVVAMAEDMLHDHNLNGVIQIAPFHPLFQFEGSGENGIDNLTNRAPYPIFHILREEEVSEAVRKLDGDSSKVWERNVNLLEKMEKTYGRSTTEKIMSGEKIEGLKDLLRRVTEEEIK